MGKPIEAFDLCRVSCLFALVFLLWSVSVSIRVCPCLFVSIRVYFVSMILHVHLLAVSIFESNSFFRTKLGPRTHEDRHFLGKGLIGKNRMKDRFSGVDL